MRSKVREVTRNREKGRVIEIARLIKPDTLTILFDHMPASDKLYVVVGYHFAWADVHSD